MERLRDFGLQEFEVAGDGNCQYRALAHQLFDNVELHADVRRTVCRQLAADAQAAADAEKERLASGGPAAK